VEVQVVNVPVARIGSEAANFVRCEILCSGVGWASVRLEAFVISKREELLANDLRLSFKFTNPVEVLPLPPALERKPWHNVWAPHLPRV
jgi:hypothetical protein